MPNSQVTAMSRLCVIPVLMGLLLPGLSCAGETPTDDPITAATAYFAACTNGNAEAMLTLLHPRFLADMVNVCIGVMRKGKPVMDAETKEFFGVDSYEELEATDPKTIWLRMAKTKEWQMIFRGLGRADIRWGQPDIVLQDISVAVIEMQGHMSLKGEEQSWVTSVCVTNNGTAWLVLGIQRRPISTAEEMRKDAALRLIGSQRQSEE